MDEEPLRRSTLDILGRMRVNFDEDIAAVKACNNRAKLEQLLSRLTISYAALANLKGVEPARRVK
jgi:L-alanine-DL-glutamate epimerase-like enolase superfamily enzyme